MDDPTKSNGNGAGFVLAFGDPPPASKTARGTLVPLADGHEWRLPPLTFYERQVHAEVLDAALGNISWTNRDGKKAQDALVALLVLTLQRNYPGVSADDILMRLDTEAACACFKIVWVQEDAHVQELLRHLGLAPPSPSPTPTGARSTDG